MSKGWKYKIWEESSLVSGRISRKEIQKSIQNCQISIYIFEDVANSMWKGIRGLKFIQKFLHKEEFIRNSAKHAVWNICKYASLNFPAFRMSFVPYFLTPFFLVLILEVLLNFYLYCSKSKQFFPELILENLFFLNSDRYSSQDLSVRSYSRHPIGLLLEV